MWKATNHQIKYIYGAGIVATGVYQALRVLYDIVPKAFIVASLEGNPSEIDGFPVVQLDAVTDMCSDEIILVAIPETFHVEVKQNLLVHGWKEEQIICVNQTMENQLLEEYVCSLNNIQTVKKLLQTNETVSSLNGRKVCVLQAKSHYDRELQMKAELPEYVTPMQVGAALTDARICQLRDNDKDNISRKNRNYCELTASYFVWKNIEADYKGICHYRRIWDITEEEMTKLTERDVDVILPYPTIHFPDIRSQHLRYIKESDWDVLIQAIEEVAPDYYKEFHKIYQGQFFYNFNMVIAKKEIFDDYCNFMFSVLQRVEELANPKGWERADRFAGYMGENLTTMYFKKNADKLNIVYVGKTWLV